MSETVKTKIPKSRAKTAYGLLGEICGLIVAEPLRYNQERFLVVQGGAEGPPIGFPSCGTVGCVAGWVVTLKGQRDLKYQDVEPIAASILGLDLKAREKLFSGSALNYPGKYNFPKPQTVEHAEAGVKHIRAFQKKYRAQLLATKV